MTEVNPFRGFIRPAFRANGIKARKDLEAGSSLEIYAAKLKSGWADEASSRIHPGRAKIDPIPEKTILPYTKTHRDGLEKL